jgi:hypothetical protein
LFLAAARWTLGERPVLVQAAQILVASAGAAYLHGLALALTRNRRTAFVAASLLAAYPLLVHHSMDGTESALLTTILLAFTQRFVTMRSAPDAAAAGVWLGLAGLTRATALPLICVAPLLALARSRRAGIVMASATLVVMAPAAIRNHSVNRVTAPARFGINLFIGNCSYAPGVVAEYGPDILMPYARARLAAEGLADLPATPDTERVVDTAFRRLALEEMRQRPLETLELKVRNVFDFFSPVLVPHEVRTAATTIRLGASGQSVVENAARRPLIQRLAYSISYGAVLLLAAFGIYRHRGDRRAETILWCVLLTFTGVHALFFPATRYRAPVEFVLLFYAAVGVDAILASRPTSRSSGTSERAGA